MNMTIWFDFYKNFSSCKELDYIYQNSTNIEALTCMNDIKEFLTKLVSMIKYNHNYKVFSMKDNLEVEYIDICDDKFLFYSSENALEKQEFFLNIDSNNNSITFSQWYNNSKEGIVLENDEDGGGLYIHFNKNLISYEWLIKYLINFQIKTYSLQI